MSDSRWDTWSRGTSNAPKMFSSFMKEAYGNPSAAGMEPAARAQQLGLQSDGHGGYIDPKTGQPAAKTVNGELVFFDAGPGGGVVSDGSGGEQLTQAQPSWSDPDTGIIMTPPAKAESPDEIASIPEPTPATPPMGYDRFMKQKKEMAAQQPQIEQPQIAQ